MGKPWNSRLTALNHWPQRPRNQRGSQTQPRTARDTHLFWRLNFKGYAPSFCGFYIVEYLHFRVLKFSLKCWLKPYSHEGIRILKKMSMAHQKCAQQNQFDREDRWIYEHLWGLRLIPRIISRLVHPSYKWIKPTDPTAIKQGYNLLRIRGMSHQVAESLFI